MTEKDTCFVKSVPTNAESKANPSGTRRTGVPDSSSGTANPGQPTRQLMGPPYSATGSSVVQPVINTGSGGNISRPTNVPARPAQQQPQRPDNQSDHSGDNESDIPDKGDEITFQPDGTTTSANPDHAT